MYVIRDIMYCRPGQVRPMVDKFHQLSKALKKHGFKPFRIMTDVCGERYWTVVSEMEVGNLEEYIQTSRTLMSDKSLQKVMKDYHQLVESGRREIYTLES
ncbi:MAG TPA: hypothetical protein VMW43_13670 [Bacteroidota bacterium]|nr:hypothetical protein [Bacteroidota bacterium]